MDEVEEMMDSLAINDDSSLYDQYVDFTYEFNTCKFFDFSMDETSYEVREAERWFRFAREYPAAPYMPKINLTNVLKSITPEKVHTTSSPELEAVEHVSPSIVTPSNGGIAYSAEKYEGLDYTNFMLADIQRIKAELKSANISSKPSNILSTPSNILSTPSNISSNPSKRSSKPRKTFMKPTASNLAKHINAADIYTDGCGRSPKLLTPTRSEIEEIKRQKLEIGFLRKVSQLKHQTSFSHKTTAKTTIPQTPKLMTEERARWRSFRSQGSSEANMRTSKALPLNRKIIESPTLPILKKSPHSPVLQKFHFEYDN